MVGVNKGRIEKIFGRMKRGLSEIKYGDITKFAAKEAIGIIPFVGQIIKDAFDEFSEDEKGEIIKELKELSESQFKEISKKVGVSVEYLKDVREIMLYSFGELRADHQEIKKLLHHLIEIQIREVNIPTIQSALKKGETFEGNFFKREPEWIDFEEGFVVERKEVNEIIKKLKNDNIQLVLGNPASGKSIILKNIGFKLAKENKDVYIVEIKKYPSDDVKRYFEDILKIKDKKSAFIVDDAHLQIGYCEKLVRDFKRRDQGKLIIGSRKTRKIKGKHPKEVSEFEYLSKTDIDAEDVTEEMIRRFLRKRHHFSDERIKTVSKNLEKYKKDLWHLSWALKAYNPEKDSVEEEEIYERIRDSIREISAGENKPAINAEDIFLPLSIFYRFEIPIERRFLEEQIGIEENIINQLIELSEIIEIEEMGKRRTLLLIHSSIADLYFETYQNYPDFGRNVKKIFQDDGIEYPLFYQYITNSNFLNTLDVVHNLKEDLYDEKGGQTLLLKLLEDKKIKNSIIKAIEKEDLEKIGQFMWDMSFVTETENGKVVEISEEVRTKLIECIQYMNLDFIYIISLKIEKEEDIEKIGYFMTIISCVSKPLGGLLANNLDIHNILSKIEKEEDVGKIGICICGITDGSKEIGSMLTNFIDIDTLLAKIEKEVDMKKVMDCVFGLTYGNAKVGLKLAKNIDFSKIKLKDIDKLADYCAICSSIELLQEIAIHLNPKVKEELRGLLEYLGCRGF